MIPHITPRAAAQAFAVFGDSQQETPSPATESELQEAIRQAKEEAWEEGMEYLADGYYNLTEHKKRNPYRSQP